jgi:flagellar biosynthesis protein FlhG
MIASNKKARRIAVISGKGGVGKTVLTANIAGALSSLGRRVLIIDADLGLANLDILLGLDPKLTIQDVLHGKKTLAEVILTTNRGFDLLPAGSGVPEGAVMTPAIAEKFELLLESMETNYDVILFDVGAGIGDVVLLFANLAHEIILVVTPEPTSLMDAYATIKILNQSYHRSEFLLVVNQANPKYFDQVGTTVSTHLQNISSRFLDSPSPVRIRLIGSIPQDPLISNSIRQRQLLADISPEAKSTALLKKMACLLDGISLACNPAPESIN